MTGRARAAYSEDPRGYRVEALVAVARTDLSVRVRPFAVMFGPILLGATWIAAVAGLPWSIVVLVVVLVSLVPAIGLANATFDDRARHVARLPPNGQDR